MLCLHLKVRWCLCVVNILYEVVFLTINFHCIIAAQCVAFCLPVVVVQVSWTLKYSYIDKGVPRDSLGRAIWGVAIASLVRLSTPWSSAPGLIWRDPPHLGLLMFCWPWTWVFHMVANRLPIDLKHPTYSDLAQWLISGTSLSTHVIGTLKKRCHLADLAKGVKSVPSGYPAVLAQVNGTNMRN